MRDPSIPLEQCEDGWLYRIFARNASLGIFRANQKGFEIAREKFGNVYLFTEYHFDTGAPFGTVVPSKKLEKAPEFGTEQDEVNWLQEAFVRYEIEKEQLLKDIKQKVLGCQKQWFVRYPELWELYCEEVYTVEILQQMIKNKAVGVHSDCFKRYPDLWEEYCDKTYPEEYLIKAIKFKFQNLHPDFFKKRPDLWERYQNEVLKKQGDGHDCVGTR